MQETAYYSWTEIETLVSLGNFTLQVSRKQIITYYCRSSKKAGRLAGAWEVTATSPIKVKVLKRYFSLHYDIDSYFILHLISFFRNY